MHDGFPTFRHPSLRSKGVDKGQSDPDFDGYAPCSLVKRERLHNESDIKART